MLEGSRPALTHPLEAWPDLTTPHVALWEALRHFCGILTQSVKLKSHCEQISGNASCRFSKAAMTKTTSVQPQGQLRTVSTLVRFWKRKQLLAEQAEQRPTDCHHRAATLAFYWLHLGLPMLESEDDGSKVYGDSSYYLKLESETAFLFF